MLVAGTKLHRVEQVTTALERTSAPGILREPQHQRLHREPHRLPPQARNALKRIAKMPYTLESAEEFEQAYLHLAHLYVDRGKFDLAQVIEALGSVQLRGPESNIVSSTSDLFGVVPSTYIQHVACDSIPYSV